MKEDNFKAGGKYFCRYCNYNTLAEFLNGTYEICEICFWEDNRYQTENPFENGGPNIVSLIQGKQKFGQFGACKP